MVNKEEINPKKFYIVHSPVDPSPIIVLGSQLLKSCDVLNIQVFLFEHCEIEEASDAQGLLYGKKERYERL